MYHAEPNPAKWTGLYVGFDSSQFEIINWDQPSVGVRVRETKAGIADNGVASGTFDSIGANDKVSLVSGVVCKMDDLTTRRGTFD